MQVIDRLPRSENPSRREFPSYRWTGWEQPRFHLALKESYGILKETLRAIPTYDPAN
jgi:hypothetical protein